MEQVDNPYRSPSTVNPASPGRWSPSRLLRGITVGLAAYCAVGSAAGIIAATLDLFSGGMLLGLTWWEDGLIVAFSLIQTACFWMATLNWRRRQDRIGTLYFALGASPSIAGGLFELFA